MADDRQLEIRLNADTAPFLNAADAAARQLEIFFKAAIKSITKEIEEPAKKPVQLQLSGVEDWEKFQKNIDKGFKGLEKMKQKENEINKVQAERTRKLKLINKRIQSIIKATRGTVEQKKRALAQINAMKEKLKLSATQMRILGRLAKKLKKDLDLAKQAAKEKAKALKDAANAGKGGDKGILGFGSLTKAGIAANLATKAVEALGQAILNTAETGIKMQSLNLQMEAFTGGVENAEKAMARFKDVAAKSPLNVMEVAEAGKIMMGFGMEVDDATEATERLAIVSAATGGDINLLGRNLGQISAQGRAYTRDLTQFAIQGIPIWEQLSQVTGKNVVELKEMAKEGKITGTEVMMALRNMTKEGSAFAEIADRMQETYAGIGAKLQSEFQTMAGEIVESARKIDVAMGDLTGQYAENLTNRMRGASEATSNLSDRIEFLRFQLEKMPWLVDAISDSWRVYSKNAKYGTAGWIPGVAPLLDGFFENLKNGIGVSSNEFKGMKEQADNLKIPVFELMQKLNELSQVPGAENVRKNFVDLNRESTELKEKLDSQIRKYMELRGISTEVIQGQIDKYKDLKEKVEASLGDIVKKYADIESAAVQAFNSSKSYIEESIENSKRVILGLQEQLQKLNKLGPAQQRLADLRRKELEYTARTGKQMKQQLSDKALAKLQAQAQLEALEKQEKQEELNKQIRAENMKIQQRQNELAELQEDHNKDILEIEKQKKLEMEKTNKTLDNLNEKIETLTRVLGGELVGNFDAIKEIAEELPDAVKPTSDEMVILNDKIKLTQGELANVMTQLDLIAKKIREMPKLKLTGQPTGNFTGGPMKAGETSVVNELGKEAFLTASGKLSMINAPAWGKWRAPEQGTVIPAHLTKKLDIPTGGIDLNQGQGVASNRFRGASNRTNIRHGDNINNTVTIQSSNPTQTANSVMVNLQKIRRMRYGR